MPRLSRRLVPEALPGPERRQHRLHRLRLPDLEYLPRLLDPEGLPDPEALNCILCPNGCRLRYEADGTISGNRCKRGEEYAIQERTAPMRTLTLTVRTEGGALVPVRTDRPIPREKLLEAAEKLQTLVLPEQAIPCGQVLAEDLFGANVIATANYEPKA